MSEDSKSQIILTDAELTEEQQNKLFEFVVYSRLLSTCIRTEKTDSLNAMLDQIILSKYGETIEKSFLAANPDTPTSFLKGLMLEKFYIDEILIDFVNTNSEEIKRLFTIAIINKEVYFPCRAGRKIYDRFFDSSDYEQSDKLDYKRSLGLVCEIGQGAYQIGNITVGEFGIQLSTETRYMPPTLNIPLWHCSDSGCPKFHGVELTNINETLQAIKKNFYFYCSSNFKNFLHGLKGETINNGLTSYPDGGKRYSDLPNFISGCFSFKEKKCILKKLTTTRAHSSIKTICNVSSEVARSIHDHLTETQIDHVLLMMDDNLLISTLDNMIIEKEIFIPNSELRTSKDLYQIKDNDGVTEASCLGVRSSLALPILELTHLLWHAFESQGMEEELRWALGAQPDDSYKHSFLEKVSVQQPDDIIKNFVLKYKKITEYICDKLEIEYISANDKQMSDRILWKTGFDPLRFDNYYDAFISHGESFKENILSMPTILNDANRAELRSYGVNFFVSAEEFLEDFLAYNVWLISSDHFGDTDFIYSKESALQCVIKVLGEEIKSGDTKARWSIDRTNTLGTVLAYINEFGTYLKKITAKLIISEDRSEEDMPHYVRYEHFIFPFLHKNLWGDSDASAFKKYCDDYETIRERLILANIPLNRNGIDHKKSNDEFPKPDSLLTCVTRVLEVFIIVSKKRYIPKHYWLAKTEVNQFTRIHHLTESRGSTFSISYPFYVLTYSRILFHRPIIISPIDFFNHPNTIPYFTVSEKSEYSELWKDYPRRKKQT